MFAALLTTVLFSLSVICGHRSARLIGGTEANFWRVTVATALLAIWAYTWGLGLSGAALPLFLASGVAGIGVGDVAFFQGLPRLGPRLSLLLIECLAPPCGALVEWLWLGTTLSAFQVLCGVVILAGVGVALAPGEHVGRPRRQLVIGIFSCSLAALGTAVGAVLSRKAYALAESCGESPDAGTAGFQRVAGGLILAGLVLLVVKRQVFRVQRRAPHQLVVEASIKKWKSVWFWVVLNSLFGQTLGVCCMQAALKTTPTGIVLAIIATTPIVAIPLAYAIEGERPTLRSFIGGLIAVGAVVALVTVGR
ncbi:MAG TPA: DMT family transporter [Verrucomicrobiae bacterium]